MSGSGRRIIALARPYLGSIILATVCGIGSMAAFVALPYVIRILIDGLILHHHADANRIGLYLIVIILTSAGFSYTRDVLLARAGGRIVADLRVRFYEHLQSLDIAFYDRSRVGDLLSRLSSDATLVQTVVTNNVVDVLQDSLRFIVVAVIVVLLDWRMALLVLALAPIIAVLAIVVGRRSSVLAERAQGELGAAAVVVSETLGAMRIVKSFGRERYEITRYSGAIERSYQVGQEAARLRALFQAVMIGASFGSIAAVIWFGTGEIAAGHLTPGGLLSFMLYLGMLTGPLQSFVRVYAEVRYAAGGAARLFQVLDTPPAIVDSPDAHALPPVQGSLALHNVSFAYGDTAPTVLRSISLDADAGETVALVGPSGAGKTTLISLILGFYRPLAGTITLDGHDIRGVTAASWRDALALVPQEPVLFGGSVRENISYGRIGATEQDIIAAARAANAHDFICRLPEGYDTIVGERGVKLSGGQRQRVAIARAILKDPRVLILDEATSSLDNESEAEVQDAINRLMAGRTTIVIAHRLTTVERVDRIVVLDNGVIVEEGTHAQLLARAGLYHRLYTRSFEDRLASA